MSENPHHGSSLESFLEAEGLLMQTTAHALCDARLYAKMADMALALSKSRAYVVAHIAECSVLGAEHEGSKKTLREIDAALDGTIHSFTRNGSAR